MTKPLILDIETGPEPAETADLFKPEFKAPSSWKDPAKIQARIADQEKEWRKQLALSPLTGRVLVVGIMRPEDNDRYEIAFIEDDEGAGEAGILSRTMATIEFAHMHNIPICGHNIRQFDLPFLVNRCRKHGVKPAQVTVDAAPRNPHIIDTMDLWACGRYGERVSLNNLALFFGLEPKTGSGADFAELYASDRNEALFYLAHDLGLTERVYRRMMP